MRDLDFFIFFRYALTVVASIYVTVVTLQSLYGWYIWLSGPDKYISLVRRYVIVHGLRLRVKSFWADVVISVLLCVVLLLLWRATRWLRGSIPGKMPTEPSNPADNGGSRQIVVASPAASAARPPDRQLSELPKDVLENLSEELGIDPTRYKTRQHLVAAVHERRQLIASLDRDAMLDVIRWGRRPVTANASREQLAREIARIKSMRFAGLSHRGLLALARLRGLEASDQDPVPVLIRKLKRQEGFFSRLNRRRRAVLGAVVAGIVGESGAAHDYRFLPDPTAPDTPTAADSASIKDEIESSGLFGGITNRIKRSADQYLNQKLDEIEARIDRKLDEIDRRLGEWRDKEIANRIRILKITLWASVIVGVFSLIYTYVTIYIWPHSH